MEFYKQTIVVRTNENPQKIKDRIGKVNSKKYLGKHRGSLRLISYESGLSGCFAILKYRSVSWNLNQRADGNCYPDAVPFEETDLRFLGTDVVSDAPEMLFVTVRKPDGTYELDHPEFTSHVDESGVLWKEVTC